MIYTTKLLSIEEPSEEFEWRFRNDKEGKGKFGED